MQLCQKIMKYKQISIELKNILCWLVELSKLTISGIHQGKSEISGERKGWAI